MYLCLVSFSVNYKVKLNPQQSILAYLYGTKVSMSSLGLMDAKGSRGDLDLYITVNKTGITEVAIRNFFEVSFSYF